jgi:hypothetical protein
VGGDVWAAAALQELPDVGVGVGIRRAAVAGAVEEETVQVSEGAAESIGKRCFGFRGVEAVRVSVGVLQLEHGAAVVAEV